MSTPFAQHNPDLIALFERLQFEPALLNQMILEMTESHSNGAAMALKFLRDHREVWHAWLPSEVAARADRALGLARKTAAGTAIQSDKVPDNASTAEQRAHSAPGAGQGPSDTDASAGDVEGHSLRAALAGTDIFPDWSAADFVNQRLMAMVKAYGDSFRTYSDFMLVTVLLPVEQLMEAIPPALFLALVAALSWHASRKWLTPVLYVVCLYAIGAVGLWDKLMQTFALVLVSTLIAIIIGVPVGIVAASSRLLRRVLTPILDVMQTLPSFVYLIPVLMLFGLGKVPALFATVVYAVPPLIRLTVLGLRHVDRNVMEAAQSFGVTRWQMLTKVTLPLARPSIMAGINQTTMMALAMVVVASMIGARGLGEDVLAGIQTLDVGRGLQAGIAIVILAIIIDRNTQAYGRTRRRRRAMLHEGAR